MRKVIKIPPQWQVTWKNQNSMRSNLNLVPVSNTPTIMLLSIGWFLFTDWGIPKKSHDLVVWSFCILLGNTDTTFSFSVMDAYMYINYIRQSTQEKEKEMMCYMKFLMCTL